MGYCDAWAAHWPGDQQSTAYGVCMAESGGNPNALGDHGNSRGLGQVYGPAHPEFAGWDLFNPEQNAQASLQIWQSSGWRAWSTYTSGAYRQFLGDTAAPTVLGFPVSLPVAQVGTLVALTAIALYLLATN